MTVTSSLQQQPFAPDLDERQYQLWYQLLEQRTGVRMAALNRDWVSARIAERLAALDIDNPDYYFQLVAAQPAGLIEWNRLLDRLMVRDTRFFRHRDSIHCVGKLWRQHQQRNQGDSFTVWSVGCSSGEEVYSLALMMEQNRLNSNACFGVIGMDISGQAIDIARSGIYSRQQLDALDEKQRTSYFEQLADGRYRVSPVLQRRTCFIRGNVLTVADSPQLQGADIIFCQNLLPYFRRWQRQQLIATLADSLKPGGHLIVGPGELANWHPPMLERGEGKAVQVYRRGTQCSERVPVRSRK